jgi:hypothetical protein
MATPLFGFQNHTARGLALISATYGGSTTPRAGTDCLPKVIAANGTFASENLAALVSATYRDGCGNVVKVDLAASAANDKWTVSSVSVGFVQPFLGIPAMPDEDGHAVRRALALYPEAKTIDPTGELDPDERTALENDHGM